MTINYQFGDVDAHGAMIRAQAGHAVCGLAEPSRGAGRAGGDAGRGGRGGL
ncbi:putative esat-6 like protein [Mycobacterium tuberculosis]|nr:putative esat-6 like protein [Mycobacterium tuberculosis]